MISRTAWMTADDAARLLGVRRATLYAYVSRGFVRSQASSASPRERAYARDDVERLRRRNEARREPDAAAGRALQWGMPVLESSIALIDGHALYYRGIDAAALARTHALEDVAELIWTGHFAPPPPAPPLRRPARNLPGLPFVARAQTRLAAAAAHDVAAMDLRPARVARTGRGIVRLLVDAACRTPRGAGAADERLAREWKVGPGGREILRAALVLCADHELNVSAFTARCVASAGSHPYAVVNAALAALEGPRHGGASGRAESMIDSLRRARPLDAALKARIRRGEALDGFGHPLYADGDPRARVLLDLLRERCAGSPELAFVQELVAAVRRAGGERPTIDFGLAAVARVLDLPRGAPLILFAIGRSVGWIGHALEQYATGQLIRPRARYVGVPPGATSPFG